MSDSDFAGDSLPESPTDPDEEQDGDWLEPSALDNALLMDFVGIFMIELFDFAWDCWPGNISDIQDGNSESCCCWVACLLRVASVFLKKLDTIILLFAIYSIDSVHRPPFGDETKEPPRIRIQRPMPYEYEYGKRISPHTQQIRRKMK